MFAAIIHVLIIRLLLCNICSYIDINMSTGRYMSHMQIVSVYLINKVNGDEPVYVCN